MTPAELAGQGWFYLRADVGLALIALAIWWLGVGLLRQRWGRWPVPGLGPLWQQLAWGAGLAAAALGTAVSVTALGGGYNPLAPDFAVFRYPVPLPPPGFSAQLWGYFAVQALFEELVFRALAVLLLGLLLYWLAGLILKPAPYQRDPTAPSAQLWERRAWYYAGVLASLAVAVAFAWVHRFNPNLSWAGLLNIALAGLVLGLICWWQGHPLGAWVLHWVWNAGMASLGLPVSGILVSPPLLDGLGTVGARPGLLSGGAFGPEGSLPAVLTLLVASGVLLWRMQRTVHSPLVTWNAPPAAPPPAPDPPPPPAE